MAHWHLYGKYEHGKETGGFVEYVRMFGFIGVLVLLIACINFVNLTTARSEKRAREVGVRKAIGSRRKDLVFQFLTKNADHRGCQRRFDHLPISASRSDDVPL